MTIMPVRPSLLLLAAAACSFSAATPVARAYALSEVRIVQVQLAPDGSFTEIGSPLVVRSFSSGVADADSGYTGRGFALGFQQSLSYDFAYTVSMHADGLPFAIGASLPPVCSSETFPACAPPVGGQSLAWAYFTIGSIDTRSSPRFFARGGKEFELELRDGSFEESGLVNVTVGTENFDTVNNGFFAVGAVTFAAAIPEPATYAQMVVGLGLLAGAFARRGNMRRRPQDVLSTAAPPAAA
jgi:hypothetical protein